MQKDADGDYIFLNQGQVDCAGLQDVTNLRDAIVIPLPEVTGTIVETGRSDTLAADGWTFPFVNQTADLEWIVRRGAAAAAVLLHRKAQREATQDLTEDLKTMLNREAPTLEYVQAMKHIREALIHGAQLVEGDQT